MVDIIFDLLGALINILPASPISGFLQNITGIPYLSFLNWFIPFDVFIIILENWATCMFVYYLYRAIKTKMDS